MSKPWLTLPLLLACSVPGGSASPAALQARVEVKDQRVTVYNDSAEEWTRVIVTLDDQAICKVGLVHPSDQAGVNLQNCTGQVPTETISQARVAADQGQVLITFGPPIQLVATPVAAPVEEPVAAPEPAAEPAAPTPTPAATARATPAAATTSSGSTTRGLTVESHVSGGFGPARRLHVVNRDDFSWTGCSVKLNDLYSYRMKDLAPGVDEGIMMVRFKDQAGNILTSNAQIEKVAVRCDQGSATVQP